MNYFIMSTRREALAFTCIVLLVTTFSINKQRFIFQENDVINCKENGAGEHSTQNMKAFQRGNRSDPVLRNTNSCTDDISLPEGFPLNELYFANKKTCRYQHMEHWSDDWQARHNVTMQRYGRKWVSDPLHWWSRSYEYSYLIQNIQSYIQNHQGVSRIVNLGKYGSHRGLFFQCRV